MRDFVFEVRALMFAAPAVWSLGGRSSEREALRQAGGTSSNKLKVEVSKTRKVLPGARTRGRGKVLRKVTRGHRH
ncbi:MAG: hypothetical protein GY854_15785 [Deltaproteobacteria bacterium]|nr:hypothetical protein [Deltaproteobacteria bacterium]